MVVISLPSTIANFDGEISHVVVAGNETLTFVRPSRWQEERMKISAKLRELAPSLHKFTSLSAVKSGEVYIAVVEGSLERSYIIRRPTPDTYSIYLIDKGMQCEAHFDDIYELPAELLDFGLFNCVCPVFVPSAQQLNIYKAFIGHKCRCEVESITRSIVVLGYVRGRLLVENGDVYEDLQDIASWKVSAEVNGLARGCATLDRPAGATVRKDTFSNAANAQADDSSSSELSYRCSSTEKAGPGPQASGARIPARKGFTVPNGEKRGQQFDGHSDAEFCSDSTAKPEALFTQTAFKQYQPDVIPTALSVRFDKTGRTMNTFWVVNKKIFSAVERVLKTSAERLADFPQLCQRGADVQMRHTPCIVRTRADTPYRALYRAVPAQYDTRTKRFSIFLVDFGWFKWVVASDIIDISTMDKSDPILNLPVALIYCREDVTSALHAKDLSKGASCDMKVRGFFTRGMLTVELFEAGSITKNLQDNAMDEKPNPREGFVNNARETRAFSSCKESVAENYQQQLLTSMMMKTLATQHQNFWPNYCPSPFPMMMPIAMPVMPMPVRNRNVPTVRNDVAVKPESAEARSLENSCVSQNYARSCTNSREDIHTQRSQGNGSQHTKKEYRRSEMSGGSAFGAAAAAATNDNNNKQPSRSSRYEGSDGLSWEQASKFAKDDRVFRKNFDGNSQKVKLTSWERAVAADRAVRSQPGNGNSIDGETNFQYKKD